MGFDTFIKGIFDINKIPTKIFFIVAIVGTFIFYAPNDLVLIKFNKDSDLKIYIYVIYLLCTGIFIINCVTGIFDFLKSKIQSYFYAKELNKHNKDVIDNLDKFERAVLREFYIYKKNTLNFPYDDAIIKGLVDKKVLYFSSQFGTHIVLSGRNSTFKINHIIKKIIDIERDLDFPNNPNLTEQNYLLRNRPHWTTNDIYFKN